MPIMSFIKDQFQKSFVRSTPWFRFSRKEDFKVVATSPKYFAAIDQLKKNLNSYNHISCLKYFKSIRIVIDYYIRIETYSRTHITIWLIVT